MESGVVDILEWGHSIGWLLWIIAGSRATEDIVFVAEWMCRVGAFSMFVYGRLEGSPPRM